MAKKTKAKAKATTQKPEAAKPSEVVAQIGKKKLGELMRSARSATADIGSINGSLREKIAYAKEHDHLHTKAFSAIRAMDRMTPEKLADYWDTLLFYMDISGLEERAKSAPRMSLEPGKGNEDGEAGEDETKTEVASRGPNVADFPKQTSVAAE